MVSLEVEGVGFKVCCKSDIKSCRLRSSTFGLEGEAESDKHVESNVDTVAVGEIVDWFSDWNECLEEEP